MIGQSLTTSARRPVATGRKPLPALPRPGPKRRGGVPSLRRISKIISKGGFGGLYRPLDDNGRAVFAEAYSVAYPVGVELLTNEIYDEVRSGNETAVS